MSPWIQYSLLRLGLFGAVFAALYLLLPAPLASIGVTGLAVVVVSAVIAAVIALTVSYIFFGRVRDAVARDLAERRHAPSGDPDAAAEDVAADPGADGRFAASESSRD